MTVATTKQTKAARRAVKKRSALQRVTAAASAKISEQVSTETEPDPLDVRMIDPKQLVDHPANDKSRVAKAAIAGLVDLIRTFGQREVVRVRCIDSGKYQILSGHRRTAACRQLGLHVRCIVIVCDDAEAIREVTLGNAERVDLNPIQRAKLLQESIDSGVDRAEAGLLFGLKSESGIKNTLRLLRLPESMQQLVIDGKVSARSAREIVPYSDATQLLDRVSESVADDPCDLDEFARSPAEFIDRELKKTTRPMQGKYSLGWQYETAERKFEVDDATREKLDIVEVAGKEYAQNVKAFDKLNRPHVKRKPGYHVPQSMKKQTSQKTDPKAQQKAEDAKLKEAAAEWASKFKRYTLARYTRPGHPIIEQSLLWWSLGDDPSDYMAAALHSLNVPTKSAYDGGDYRAILRGSMQAEPGDLFDRLWRIMVWPVESDAWPVGPIVKLKDDHRLEKSIEAFDGFIMHESLRDTSLIDDQIVAAGVSIEAAWRDAGQPSDEQRLLREFCKLHNDRQLATLCRRWKVKAQPKAEAGKDTEREQIIDAIIESHAAKPLPAPSCLALKPKAKRGAK